MSLPPGPPHHPNPYALVPGAIEEPPTEFLATLRRIGPGMVLAASIVGSGELIATTTLGAQAGYTALWVVLLSCLIKPVIQARTGPLHHRHRRNRPRGPQSHPRPARGTTELARVGMGTDGGSNPAAGRGDVRRRLAGDAPPHTGRAHRRMGRHLPRAHARAAPRRRVRAGRTDRDGQGRPVHRHHRTRGGRADPHAALLLVGRGRRRPPVRAAALRHRHGDRGVRHHRRRRRGAVHVSVLVRRKRLRPVLRRAASRQAGGSGARGDGSA